MKVFSLFETAHHRHNWKHIYTGNIYRKVWGKDWPTDVILPPDWAAA